jgi:hypothetical protein
MICAALNQGKIEGHNSRVRKGEMLTEYLWGKSKLRYYLEVPVVNGRMVLICALKKCNRRT